MTAPVPDPAAMQEDPQAVEPQAQEPQQPIPSAPPEADGVDLAQFAKAIDSGTNLAAAAQSAEDYLKLAQGVKALAEALTTLEGETGGEPQEPAGGQEA